MKKSISFLSLCLLGLFAIAQTNDVVIYSEQGEKFYLYVNGVKQNETPKSNVRGKDITSEHFQVRVKFEDSSIPDITQNFWTESKDVEITAVVREARRGYSIRYRGESPKSVQQAAATHETVTGSYEDPRASQGTVTTTHTGGAAHQESVSMSIGVDDSGAGGQAGVSTHVGVGQESVSMSVGVGDESVSFDMSVSDTGVNMSTGTGHGSVSMGVNVNTQTTGHHQQTGTGTGQTVTTQTQTAYSGFMPNGSMCAAPTMDQIKYMDFRYAIEAENMFRREQFIINTIRGNCLLAVQVAGIMEQNYSTVNELEVAKQAYRYTYDTENYGVVVNALRSESQRKELMTFLGAGQTGTVHVTHTHTHTQTTVPDGQVVVVESKPDHYQMPGYRGKVGCPWPMEKAEFESAKKSIGSKSFEDSRLTVAKQITSSNCLTCDQIKEVMGLFSFESTKLEFAKFAYDYAFDLNNYYKLNDAFTFESSISELNDYIQKKK